MSDYDIQTIYQAVLSGMPFGGFVLDGQLGYSAGSTDRYPTAETAAVTAAGRLTEDGSASEISVLCDGIRRRMEVRRLCVGGVTLYTCAFLSSEKSAEIGFGLPCGAFSARCSPDCVTLTSANDAFYALFGYTKKSFDTLTDSQRSNLICDNNRGILRDSVLYAAQNCDCIEVGFTVNRRNGAVGHLYMLAEVDNPESEYFNISGVLIDQTSRHISRRTELDSTSELFGLNDSIDIGIAKISEDMRLVIYLNKSFCRITGCGRDELNSDFRSTMDTLLSAAEPNSLHELLSLLSEEGDENRHPVMLTRRDGEHFWVNASVRRYPSGYILSLVDINDLKLAEQEVALKAERHNALEELSNEIVFEYDVAMDTLSLPKRYTERIGGSSEIHGFIENLRTCSTLDETDATALIRMASRLRRGEAPEALELRSSLFTGQPEWYSGVLSAVYENDRPVRVIGKLINIDDAKREQLELSYMTQRDPMTQLLNKVAANRSADAYIAGDGKDRVSAFIIIDIDNFKAVNDNLGHMFGDTVLENVSAALKARFRESDIIGRIGGDEFMVVMKDVNEDIVKRKAREICDVMCRTYSGELAEVSVSSSIGIAMYPEDGGCFDSLYHNADVALYATKRSGKNSFTFYREAVELNAAEESRPERDVRSPAYIRRAEAYDLGIISFAFDLLAETEDLGSAVNMLLDKLGSTSHFTGIAIYLTEPDYSHIRTAYEWSCAGGTVHRSEPEITGFSDWIEFLKLHDERGIMSIDDCEASAYGSIAAAIHARSIVSCMMFEHGKFLGFITAFTADKSRHWTHQEKDTFAELSKMLSYFIGRSTEESSGRQDESSAEISGTCSVKEFRDIVNKAVLESETGSGYAVLCYDILNFKQINEVHGYAAGDRILCEFSEYFGSENPDCIEITRTYADHFLAFVRIESRYKLTGTVIGMATEFSAKINQEYNRSDLEVITGGYILTDDVKTADSVINCANLARQFVKETSGTGYAFYDDFLQKTVFRESQIIRSVNEALQRGEMEPYLQPKLSAKTGKIVGAEALARWEREDAATLFPDDFVPILERTGAIVELDFYIYERVLTIVRGWLEQGLPAVPVSINLSRRHCTNIEFDKRLIDLARHYGVPASLICFEFKESTFFDDTQIMSEKINLLREAGFSVCLDNIGADSPYFRLITDLNVDELKIDSSFARKCINDERSRKIFKSMIEVGKALGSGIVCEGIEDIETGRLVCECGCETLQGYLYASPMAADEFEKAYL